MAFVVLASGLAWKLALLWCLDGGDLVSWFLRPTIRSAIRTGWTGLKVNSGSIREKKKIGFGWPDPN